MENLNQCKMCKNCEHFHIIQEPLPHYFDAGLAQCSKYNLVVDFFSERKLNKLECAENDIGALTELEQKDLCAEIISKICSFADKQSEERKVCFFKILSLLFDFENTHDIDNLII